MEIVKYICCFIVSFVFIATPAMADVILTPTGNTPGVSRLYGYASSLQGPDSGLFGDGEVGEGEWNILTGSLNDPSVSAEHDPIPLVDDGYLLDGDSSFAIARSSMTDLNGWGTPDGNDVFHLFVNNQASQNPGGSSGPYGPNGWGYSVSYLMMTYNTSPANGSSYGDPMTVTMDLDFSQELYAFGVDDEYFLELGYAMGTELTDYDPALEDPYTQPNPGLDQFDAYKWWWGMGDVDSDNYQQADYSDSLEYTGVIGDQVQVLISLSSLCYSRLGYSWTSAALDPTVGVTQSLMLETTEDPIPYTSMKAIISATTPVPEPMSLLLYGAGLLGLAGLRKKKKEEV